MKTLSAKNKSPKSKLPSVHTNPPFWVDRQGRFGKWLGTHTVCSLPPAPPLLLLHISQHTHNTKLHTTERLLLPPLRLGVWPSQPIGAWAKQGSAVLLWRWWLGLRYSWCRRRACSGWMGYLFGCSLLCCFTWSFYILLNIYTYNVCTQRKGRVGLLYPRKISEFSLLLLSYKINPMHSSFLFDFSKCLPIKVG